MSKGYIRNAWYVLGFSEELGTELSGSVIAGRPLVAWRANDGRVGAFDGRCRHKQFPLAEGRLRDGVLECGYHGWCYDETGRCVSIPSQPSGHIPSKANLHPYPVEEQDGLVWIWTGDPERIGTAQPPRTPEIGRDDFDTVRSDPSTARANYRLLIENVLDITHFYPLHEGNIGDLANSLIPVDVTEEEVDGNHTVMTTREVQDYELPPYFRDWFGLEVVDRVHTHRMLNPGIIEVRIRLAAPGRLGTPDETGYVLYHMQTPVDGQNLIWRWTMNCPAGSTPQGSPGVRLVDRIAATAPEVVAQDRWAIQKQQEMLDLHDASFAEVHVKADTGVIRARRVLERLEAAERDDGREQR